NPGKAGHDDWIVTTFGKAAQRLLALGVVGYLELGIFDSRLLAETFRAHIGHLVERFVEFSAQIIKKRRADFFLGDGCRGHSGCGQKAENDTFHMIHTLSVSSARLSNAQERAVFLIHASVPETMRRMR